MTEKKEYPIVFLDSCSPNSFDDFFVDGGVRYVYKEAQDLWREEKNRQVNRGIDVKGSSCFK
jgi:hypothetical protein